MKPIGRTAVCTVLFLVALGAAFAQQVKTDFDHQANFFQYKTYSWQEIKPANSLWDARIKNAVDAQLAAKGWTHDAKTKQLIWRGSAEDTEQVRVPTTEAAFYVNSEELAAGDEEDFSAVLRRIEEVAGITHPLVSQTL